MNNPLNPLYGLPPIILTYAQLEAVLLPLVMGDAWAVDTIGDLWRYGAPVPGGGVEKRIVLPGKLYEWLADVLTRRGLPLDAAAKSYVRAAQAH